MFRTVVALGYNLALNYASFLLPKQLAVLLCFFLFLLFIVYLYCCFLSLLLWVVWRASSFGNNKVEIRHLWLSHKKSHKSLVVRYHDENSDQLL